MQNDKRLAKLHFRSFAKVANAPHRRLRVPGGRRISAWWKVGKHHQNYPRPRRNHHSHTSAIRSKRFNVWKLRAWKKHLHILRKWKAHYRRKGGRARRAMKSACGKSIFSRKGKSKNCLRRRKNVAKLAAKLQTYTKLMQPYKRAVKRAKTKMWTPTSVVRAARNFRLKVKKKKMKIVTIPTEEAATKSRRRRSWMHFNPFKSKSSSKKKNPKKSGKKKAAKKKAAKGTKKGKSPSSEPTFRSEAVGAFKGGKIHMKKPGQRKTRAARCFYYRRQAKAISNMAKQHPLKSKRRGRMFSTIRLPKNMLKSLATAKAYLKKHCKKF